MARFTRAAFVEVIGERFRAHRPRQGLKERVVIAKHCLRNALIPVVTMMGLQFGFLLGGSIVVEAVFNWPGMGRLLVDAVNQRDYPVIQAPGSCCSRWSSSDQPGRGRALRPHQPRPSATGEPAVTISSSRRPHRRARHHRHPDAVVGILAQVPAASAS